MAVVAVVAVLVLVAEAVVYIVVGHTVAGDIVDEDIVAGELFGYDLTFGREPYQSFLVLDYSHTSVPSVDWVEAVAFVDWVVDTLGCILAVVVVLVAEVAELVVFFLELSYVLLHWLC